MVREATFEDKEQLVNIWRICFGDEIDFIENFISYFANRDKIYVYETDNKVVSAIHCMNGKIKFGEEIYDGWYLYAVATLPEYRKKGFVTAMIEHIKNIDDGKDILFLTPSNEKNRAFYSSLGFENHLSSYTADFTPTDKVENISVCEYSNENFEKIREKVYENTDYVLWDNNHISFALCDEGFLYIVKYNGETVGYVHGYSEEKTVDELCVKGEFAEQTLNILCKKMKMDKITVNLPYEFVKKYNSSCKIDKGMVYFKFSRVSDCIKKCSPYLCLNLE